MLSNDDPNNTLNILDDQVENPDKYELVDFGVGQASRDKLIDYVAERKALRAKKPPATTTPNENLGDQNSGRNNVPLVKEDGDDLTAGTKADDHKETFGKLATIEFWHWLSLQQHCGNGWVRSKDTNSNERW